MGLWMLALQLTGVSLCRSGHVLAKAFSLSQAALVRQLFGLFSADPLVHALPCVVCLIGFAGLPAKPQMGYELIVEFTDFCLPFDVQSPFGRSFRRLELHKAAASVRAPPISSHAAHLHSGSLRAGRNMHSALRLHSAQTYFTIDIPKDVLSFTFRSF